MFRAWPTLLDCRHRRVGVDVTGTRTITQFADRVAPIRVFVLLVRIGLVIVGMTAGAIGLVSCGRPEHDFGVVLVAGGAGQVSAMIQWLVGQADVHVDVRNPGIRCVAGIAFLLCDEMPEILAGGNIAVVTGGTRAENLRVVDHDYRAPGDRRVAGFTDIRCQRMHRALTRCINAVVAAKTVVGDIGVIEVRRYPGYSCMAIIAVIAARDMPGILAVRNSAVMAGHARSQHLRVIHPVGRFPEDVVVAVFAHVGCRNVHRALTGGVYAVMATNAVAGDVHVVEVRRYPRDSRMTVIAIVAACDVIHILARRIDAVMTRKAGAKDLQMVDRKHGRPRSIAVAILTHVCGQYVGGIFSGGVQPVVAVETAIDDIGMIEIRGDPCNGCMTVVAGFAALNMCRILAGCGRTIVARVAGTQYVQCVYCDGRVPEIGTVAVFAHIRRQDMGWSLAGGVGTVVTAETVAGDVRVIKYGWDPGEC